MTSELIQWSGPVGNGMPGIYDVPHHFCPDCGLHTIGGKHAGHFGLEGMI